MNLVQKRFKKAQVFARLLSTAPFIKMIALTGSLAKGRANPSSDIDFFIITQKGRIWTSRFLIVSVLKLLGQYRSEENPAGKICPNRYHSEDALKIQPQNAYHAEEYSQIVPLFDIGDVYQKFQEANKWMIKKLKTQNSKLKTTIKNSKLKNNYLLELIKKIGERLLDGQMGDFLEGKLRAYQKKRILWDKRSYQQKARIIISDRILCFNPTGKITQMAENNMVK